MHLSKSIRHIRTFIQCITTSKSWQPISCAQTPYFLDYNGFPQYFDQDFGFLLNVERGLPQDFFWEKKHIAFTVMERQYLRSINSKLLSRHQTVTSV